MNTLLVLVILVIAAVSVVATAGLLRQHKHDNTTRRMAGFPEVSKRALFNEVMGRDQK